MSGFDIGAVSWSQQRSTDLEGETPYLERHAAQAKFYEFLRTFQTETEGQQSSEVYKYSDALIKDKSRLRVDLQDVKLFDPDLGACLQRAPTEYLPLLEAAARERVQRGDKLEEDAVQVPSDLQVFLHSTAQFGPASMRELMSSHVSQLVMMPGIVTHAATRKHKATYVRMECKTCHTVRTVTCKPGFGGAMIPRTCDAATVGGQGNTCGQDPFIILPAKTQYVDQQQLKLQERPEEVPTGELPQSMTLIVDRHLVGKISPGTRVTVIGIYSIYQSKEAKNRDGKGGVAIKQPYLRVVGLEEDIEGDSHNSPTFTMEEEAAFKAFAAQPNVHEQIFSKVAPNIFGHADIKKAVACLLFGGSRKRMPDATARRGDINVLLMGDPSTAKSQFLKFAAKTAPISVYTSGKGSSAAGLTATVVKDNSGEFFLEGGAMVLADNGVVCIDEFDKMRPEDRVAIHEAMEQQTISIAKAGITTMLKSRTSVLAAANPPSGRYDDMKTAQENIDLQTTILSRFDLIFIVKDERSMERDKRIAQHVIQVHRDAGSAPEADEEDKKAEEFLKRYLEYCRVKCSPRLTPRAATTLVTEYVEIRDEVRTSAQTGGGDLPAVPITVRQLEAVVRISESLARMQLQVDVTENHVQQAMDLFKTSTMDAVRSGATEGMVFTEEQKGEMHNVRVQIKRRVSIGGFVSEAHLVEELVRMGMDGSLVRRALCYLVQQGEFEYKKERRLVHRLQ
ncbi:hypothetical protein ABBQ32_013645 [Trebouxia sp. C0010 RCD-2024]